MLALKNSSVTKCINTIAIYYDKRIRMSSEYSKGGSKKANQENNDGEERD